MSAPLLTLACAVPPLACAVCGAGNDPAQGSYVVMSLIISFLPLAMLGGIVVWVVRSARQAERAEKADAGAPPASAPDQA
ncbi:MAG: hypothetical protein U0228_21105 [Myxococcaceae bacterium]